MIARVAPERRRVARARLRPDDHVRAERALAYGRIDLQVVHFLVALHPAVRIGVENRDDRLRDRQRHAYAIAAIFEAEPLRIRGDLLEELLLVLRGAKLKIGVLPAQFHSFSSSFTLSYLLGFSTRAG
ncbi:hypothetical protein X947_5744 [Burkholderia pseudomallei MSHR7334]|nr:hypothetical protein X947_5744 [Burkholderia pseudomallei MSHR7334]